MNDLVSVLIPCYNCEKYVEEAVRSIMLQTYKNLEILITDDGSSDNSYSILERLSSEDKRIKLFRHSQNQGIVIALNEMINASKGKFICRMDCDDISLPERIEKQVKFLKAHEEIDVCGTFAYDVNLSGKILYKNRLPISPEDNKKFLKYFTTLYHPTVMARDTFYKTHLYNTDFRRAQDYELWARAVYGENKNICSIPEYLLKYRMTSLYKGAQYGKSQSKNASLALKKFNVIPEKYIDEHCDIFFTRTFDSDINRAKDYAEKVLKSIKTGNFTARMVVVEKIISYFVKRKEYGEALKLLLSPIGIIMFTLNRYRKLRTYLAGK